MSDDNDPFEEARLEELATIPIADMEDEELGTLEAECLSIGGHRGGRLRAVLFELRRHRRAVSSMAPVVAAAESYVDHGPVGAGIVEAVKAYRAKGGRPMKLDLEELERLAKASGLDGLALIHAASPPVVLALIAHVRALHAALIRAAELTEGTVSCETQYDCAEDDPDWKEAQRWRELVTRGAVLP